MKNRLIITLPICPYNNMSVGKMTTPILGESLAKSLNANFVMSINKLSTYSNREYNDFIKLLKNYKITPDDYWIDYNNVDKLLENIYYLIRQGYIMQKEKIVLKCNCGKTEISIDNLDTINMKDSLLERKNEKYFCKCCKNECIKTIRDVLVFNPKNIDKSSLKFYPRFINKDKKTFDYTVGNNDIIITRDRETNIIIEHNNKKYNLDIDFLWEVYLSLFDEQEKIVMCCNHQLYQLYMVGMLEKCFNNTCNTICLATPYLENSIYENELENRIMSLKIFSLLSQKWSKKENKFDTSLLKYINSMNVNKKQQLYDIIVSEIENTDMLENDLNFVLTKKYNFQNSNNELKKRRKNV